MPVIVAPEDYGKWIGENEADPVRPLQMLRPFPAEAMMAFPVDARVGNVKNDEANLIEAVATVLSS
jgi:putative SOS response-associated peptidase YedK